MTVKHTLWTGYFTTKAILIDTFLAILGALILGAILGLWGFLAALAFWLYCLFSDLRRIPETHSEVQQWGTAREHRAERDRSGSQPRRPQAPGPKPQARRLKAADYGFDDDDDTRGGV